MLYLRFSLINDSFWFFYPVRHGLYCRGTTGEAAQVSIDRYGGSGHGGQVVCDESGDGRGDVADGNGGTD